MARRKELGRDSRAHALTWRGQVEWCARDNAWRSAHLFSGEHVAVVVKTVLVSHFEVIEFATQFGLPILLVGLVDVHWGLTDLDFEKPVAM